MSENGLALLTQDDRLRRSLERRADALDHVTIQCASTLEPFESVARSPSTTSILLDAKGLGAALWPTIDTLVKTAQKREIPILLLEDGDMKVDQPRALEAGISEIVARTARLPVLLKTLERFHRFELYFWGVRGTLPVSGRNTLKYGGSTSSISLRMGSDRHFIFDAGTGLRNLSRYLMRKESGHFNGRLFITHPHWDHLNCIAKIFTATFASDHSRINLTGGDICRAVKIGVEKAFIVSDIKVCLGSVIGYKNLTVLKRIHGPGINVDIRIQLLHCHF